MVGSNWQRFLKLGVEEPKAFILDSVGSEHHTSSILSPIIQFLLLLELDIPWKNVEFSSPSSVHLLLDFCLRSRTLVALISCNFITTLVLSVTNRLSIPRTSFTISMSTTSFFRESISLFLFFNLPLHIRISCLRSLSFLCNLSVLEWISNTCPYLSQLSFTISSIPLSSNHEEKNLKGGGA